MYMLNIPYHHFSITSCFLLGPCAWLGSVHVLDKDQAQFGLGPSCTNLKVFGPHPPFHQKLEDPINKQQILSLLFADRSTKIRLF